MLLDNVEVMNIVFSRCMNWKFILFLWMNLWIAVTWVSSNYWIFTSNWGIQWIWNAFAGNIFQSCFLSVPSLCCYGSVNCWVCVVEIGWMLSIGRRFNFFIWPGIFMFQFLRCREAWLTGILEELDQKNAYEYLKGMINCHRMHLFDVVNQYRAIFADDTSGSEENYDGGLLFSWAMHQITSHLKTLKLMLPKITEGGSLSNILDQCMVRMLLWISYLCNFFYAYLHSTEIPIHSNFLLLKIVSFSFWLSSRSTKPVDTNLSCLLELVSQIISKF